MKVVTAACLFMALTVSTDALAQLKVGSSNQRQSLACKGQSVMVSGSSNTLSLSGQCGRIGIEGSDNVLTIEAVDEIEVIGQRNRITWQRTITSGMKSPRFSAVGPGNTIDRMARGEDRPAAPAATAKPAAPAAPKPTVSAPARAPAAPKEAPPAKEPAPARRALSKAWTVDGNTLRLAGNGLQEQADCEGRDVIVMGNSNSVTLRGECGVVSTPGTGNTIDVEAAIRVRAEGNNNSFTWHRTINGKEPEATLLGRRSTIRKVPGA